MNEKLTNDASWVTALSIMTYLHKFDGVDSPEVFAAIFKRVKAGIVTHQFLARRQEPPSPSSN